MLPLSLSLPCMNACWPLSLPATIAKKSASFMVIVQSGLAVTPLHIFPSFFKSKVHFPASFRSKQKIALVFLQRSGPLPDDSSFFWISFKVDSAITAPVTKVRAL